AARPARKGPRKTAPSASPRGAAPNFRTASGSRVGQAQGPPEDGPCGQKNNSPAGNNFGTVRLQPAVRWTWDLMADELDYEIVKTPEERLAAGEVVATTRHVGPWIVAAVVLAAAIAVYFVGLRRPAAPVATPQQVQSPAKPSEQPLGGAA